MPVHAQNQLNRQDAIERQRQRQELRQQIVEQHHRAQQDRLANGGAAQAPVYQGGVGSYANPVNPYAAPANPPGYRNDGTPRLSVEERQQLRRQLREAHGQPPAPDGPRP